MLLFISSIFLLLFLQTNASLLPCSSPRSIFASTSNKDILIWDLAEQSQCISKLIGHTSTVTKIVFSKDFQYAFSSSYDKTVNMWNIATRVIERTLTGHTGNILSLDISSDGSKLASGDSDGYIKIWSTIDFSVIYTLKAASINVQGLSFTNDGKSLICGTNKIEIFDINTGLVKAQIVIPSMTSVSSLAITHDDKYLITGGASDFTANLIDLATNQVVGSFSGHSDTVMAVAVDSKNSVVATASADNKVKTWDIKTKSRIKNFVGHSNIVMTIRFTSDDVYLLSGSTDKNIKLWDVSTGICISTLYGLNTVMDLKISEECIIKSSGPPIEYVTCDNQFTLLNPTPASTICTNNINLASCQNCLCDGYVLGPLCLSACPTPYWTDQTVTIGDSTFKECLICDDSCKTCSGVGPLKCLTCKSGTAIPYHENPIAGMDGQCLGSCQSPNPFADDTTGRCQNVCPTTWGLSSTNKCVTNCPSDFFIDYINRMCEQCDISCDTCSGAGSTKCLTCSSLKVTKYHELPTTNTDGSCLSSCTNLYPYADDNSNRCYAVCPIPYWGLASSSKCEVSCPSGYYSNSLNRMCEQCDSTCETCSGSGPTKCITCSSLKANKYHEFPTSNTDGHCLSSCSALYPFSDDNTNRCYLICPIPSLGLSTLNQCVPSCPLGFSTNLAFRICELCDSTCDSCSGPGSTKCLTCSSLKATKYHELPTSNSEGGCLSLCTALYPYADDNTNRCYLVCPTPLWGLSSSKKCVASCPSTYNQLTRECQSIQGCSSACKTCQQSNICTSCNSPYFLSSSDCVAACPSPLWGNNDTRTCASYCTNKNEYGDENDKRICKKCASECATCLNQAYICTSCLSGLFFFDNGVFVTCSKCDGIGAYVSGSTCYSNIGGCLLREHGNSCDKCSQGLFRSYTDRTQSFEANCKKCDSSGEYIDESYSYTNGSGVCLSHAECTIIKCKKCYNLLKRCSSCETGYNLYSYQGSGDGKDYCSVCNPDLYLKNDTVQSKMICSPKKIISGKLIAVSNPETFVLAFNDTWDDYFKNYHSNFVFKISQLSDQNYECLIQRSISLNNYYEIFCSYTTNVSTASTLKVSLLNIPIEQEDSEVVIRGNDYELNLETFTVCPENFSISEGNGFCQPVSLTYINVDIRNTIDPLKYDLVFNPQFPDIQESEIYRWIKGKFENGSNMAQGIDYDFSVRRVSPTKLKIEFNFNETINNGPIFHLEINSKDPEIKFSKTKFPIIIQDYYNLDEEEKLNIASKGKVSQSGSKTAESLVPLNNIFSPQSTFAVKGLLLIQTFQLLRFINISYPPNVLELFDEKLSSFMYDFDIQVKNEDIILSGQYYKFNFSVYILNNSGSYMLGGFIYFLFGILGFYLIPFLMNKIINKQILYALKQLENTLVWNLYLTHFLSRYMILAFTALAGLRFPSLNTHMGRFNICISIISTLFIYYFPILILLKLIEIKRQKYRKTLPQVQFFFRDTLKSYSKIFNTKLKTLNSPRESMLIQNFMTEKNPSKFKGLNGGEKHTATGDSLNTATQSENIYSNELKIKQINDSFSSKRSVWKPTEILDTLGNQPNEKYENRLSSRNTETAINIEGDENTEERKIDSGLRNDSSFSKEVNNSGTPKINIIQENKNQNLNHDPEPSSASKNRELERLKKCYKPIHEEYLHDHFLKYNFLIIELSRQIIISHIILFSDNRPVTVSLSIMLINGIFIIFMIWIKPFKSLLTLVLALIVEFFLFIICLGTLGLAFLQELFNTKGLTHDLELYMQIGWIIVYAYIILVYFYLVIQAINYFILIKELYKEFYPKLKNCLKKGKIINSNLNGSGVG